MPLTTDDRIEITALYARYNHAIDLGDPDGWADTFTPEGTFESPNAQPSGRDALFAFADNAAKSGRAVRHWTSNLVVEPAEGGASGTCYLILWDVGQKPQSILVTGIYRDELVKAGDEWRFAARRVSLD